MDITRFRELLRSIGRRLTPRRYREVMAAYRNEAAYIDEPERKSWGRASFRIWVWSVTRQLFAAPFVGLATIVCGLLAAVLDRELASRIPYTLALFVFALGFSILRPRHWIRSALLLATVLPALAFITGEFGPYARDRMDLFYGVVPSLLGAGLVRATTA